MWSVVLTLRYRDLEALEDALGAVADALASAAIEEAHPLEMRPDDRWRLTAYVTDAARRDRLIALARAALVKQGSDPQAVLVEPVEKDGWVARVEAASPPQLVGRFLIHGAHVRPPQNGRRRLVVNASTAFGSGRHESTQGCLIALERLARLRGRPHRPLDLGAGSGILACAMTELWRRPVVASDIDQAAIAATRETARRNGKSTLVRALCANGFAARALKVGAPFDLICANILAGPLVRLAPALSRRAGCRARLILAGLLAEQEAWVMAAYRMQGFRLIGRVRLGVWTTLILARGRLRAGWPRSPVRPMLGVG